MSDPLSSFLQGAQVSGVEIGADKKKVSTHGHEKLLRVMSGLPRTAIAAAASADCSVIPTDPFKPESLILSAAAQGLDVTQFKIGSKPLNITSNPMPGNAFAENAVGTRIEGYTAQTGVGFTVSFTNNTVASITTGGVVFGWAAV